MSKGVLLPDKGKLESSGCLGGGNDHFMAALNTGPETDSTEAGDQAPAEAERCFHCGHCRLCGNCVEDCPGYVLSMTDQGPRVEHPEECWHCGNCRISCPSAAVSYEFPISMLV